MRTFIRIIAEQDGPENWSAWFANVPNLSAGGNCPATAIRNLLDFLGPEEFDINEMFAIEELTTMIHLEFRIPHRSLKRMPKPSAN